LARRPAPPPSPALALQCSMRVPADESEYIARPILPAPSRLQPWDLRHDTVG
jgi:hypothetical protein